MVKKSFRAALGYALCLGTLYTTPAFADVKAGVDAWSRGEYEAAVKEWRGPALKGDSDAQFNMGQAYKLGRGVKSDLSVALDWYRRAAQQGHLQAADSYGHLLHYQGKVTDALPYLQASSERGEPRAQYLLATELFNGVHMQKDWVRAYALMTRASSSGMAAASRSLAQMDQYIPIEQRQQGTVLAGELEKRANANRSAQVAGFPINSAPPTPIGRPVDIPPSVASPSTASGYPDSLPPPLPTNPGSARPSVDNYPVQPVKRPVPATRRPAPAVATVKDSGWRIQLGAFSNEDNARKLWNSLEARVDTLAALQPYLKATGRLTRLQAGPFASRGAADTACVKVRAAGQTCISVNK
jgi:cell division septation protein DedD